MGITIYQYEGFEIHFEEVNGQIMANATTMAKPFNKEPNDIFKTKSWKEYEEAITIGSYLRSEDIRTVKNGDNGGSWIHQELVIEFARRLKPAFAVWCNRKIAELLRTGKVELKPLTPAEQNLQNAQLFLAHENSINELKRDVEELKAQIETSPTGYYTAAGYASLQNINIDITTANTAGRKASKECKEQGYVIGKMPDPRFGSVNTYPIHVLQTVFKNIGLTR